MKSRNYTKGFTLIEVVVVVTILVLLAGVLVPIVSNELTKARGARAQTDLKGLGDAFTRYNAHTASWPGDTAAFSPTTTTNGDLAGFPCLFTNTFSLKGWAGPYLNSGYRSSGTWIVASIGTSASHGLIDPWGHYYRYYNFARGGSMGVGGGIVFVCAGENGTVDSSNTQLSNGEAGGDDIVQVVTRRL